MRGYLKGPDNNVIQLNGHTTTVGRAGCDMVINDPTINPQHAMIEPRENEGCYIIRDLNTTHGTYVNECFIQNAAVRLSPGDVIRFGYNAHNVFLLHTDDQYHSGQMHSYPQQLPQSQWSGQEMTSLPPISSTVTAFQQNQQFSQGTQSSWLPQGSATMSATAGLPYPTTSTWSQGHSPSVLPPRPPMKPRPVSAGALPRRFTVGPLVGALPGGQGECSAGSVMMQGYTVPNGWSAGDDAGRPVAPSAGRIVGLGGVPPHIDTETRRLSADQRPPLPPAGPPLAATEVSYLEKELQRRDSAVSHLQQDIVKLQQSLQAAESSSASGDANLIYQLQGLQHDIDAKNETIKQLQEQVLNQSTSDPAGGDGSAELRNRLIEKEKELIDVRSHMEKSVKNSDSSSMLVTTLQRDLTRKSSENDELSQQLEDVKKQLRDKDVELSAMSVKFSRVKDYKKMEDDLEEREKEMSTYRMKLQEAEVKHNEHAEFIQSVENELKRATEDVETRKQSETVLRLDLEKSKSAADDLETSLKQLGTQLEESHSKSECFRQTVVQILFSVPGLKLPNEPSSVEDAELFDLMRKTSDERIETQRKNRELKENLRTTEHNSKELNSSLKKLKKNMTEFTHHLQDQGRSSSALRTKITEMESMSVDEGLKFIKDASIDVLFGELSWQQPIDEALLKAGFDQELIAKDPAQQIGELHAKLCSTEAARDDLSSTLATAEDKFNADMQAQIEGLEQSSEQQRQVYEAQIEEMRVKYEEQLNVVSESFEQQAEQQALNEMKEAELIAEKQNVVVLHANIHDLNQVISGKDGDIENIKDQLRISEDLLEQFKNAEVEYCSDLKRQLSEVEQRHQQEVEGLKVKWNESNDNDLASYKEQILQHSLTIVAMEDKLLAANKLIKQMNSDSTAKDQKLQEYEHKLEKRANKPVPAAKPVIVPPPKTMEDLYALEQLVLVLRRESAEVKRVVAVRDGTIHSLNRDLAGANAKLSDLTSELSEKQKEELERSRAFLKDQHTELTTQRTQISSLTELIETQKREINKLHKELKHSKTTSSGKESEVSDLRLELLRLKSLLEQEQTHSHNQLESQENEGKITSELTSMGAQCRGERHEQVIMRQKDALADLRQRIRLLEQNRPPIPSQDQALQHVAVLKRELNDLRAQQGGGGGSRDVPEPDLGWGGEMGGAGMVAESTVERSARLETLEALESSEKTYLDLNRGVTNALSITTIKGQRSMMHQPRDEREKLSVDREKDCELMKGKIQSLFTRVERKDELLNSYEGDLARLRDIEKIVQKKVSEADSLQNEMRTRNEEIEFVREALKRTKGDLEREKRLNAAIKSKKTYHIEQTEQGGHGWPRHYCQPEEINGQTETSKKGHNEKLKKKVYEVERLKEDLHRKDQQITDMTAKIINLEHSMGLSGPA